MRAGSGPRDGYGGSVLRQAGRRRLRGLPRARRGLRAGRARRWLRALGPVLAVLAAIAMITAGPAAAAPSAPAPTSSELSPSAPDPNPPLGGRDDAGRVVGGDQLIDRGLLLAPGSPPLPDGIPATSFVVSDLDTGQILAARDPHGRYQPASILKLLTSLVLLPQLPGDRPVQVSANAAGTEGSAVGLVPGGTYSVDQLFTAMMLMSGNDATMALSEAAGGVDVVVAQMNAAMAQLGAVDTVVETPSGLDGWSQLTSAYDMSLVLRQAAANPRLVAYDEQRTGELAAQDVAGRQYGPVPLAHQGWQFLDDVPGALLVKSGYTDAARSTYVAAAQRGDHRYGVVLMRSERTPLDLWQQAAALFDWAAATPSGATGVGQLVDPVSPLPSSAPDAESGSAPAPTSSAPPAGPSGAAADAPSSPSSSPSSSGSPTASAAPGTSARVAPAGASGASGDGSALGSSARALGVAAAAILLGGLAAAGAARRRRPSGRRR